MDGRVTGISGPTVTARIGGVKLCDMVLVGHAGLVGEVVRLDGEQAVVQVYENTLGLGVGEPVVGTGGQLTVTLGPGLVSTMYDGLQRPLERVRAAVGPFIRPCRDIPPWTPPWSGYSSRTARLGMTWRLARSSGASGRGRSSIW
ncbi:hypothetical protein [Geobacter sp. FeAm09]|uniref:hypothetical protein n=1 Tax=Geobacter sp. FeAm09 TaxID=2597769 RepID=UPI001F0EB8BD|nr:hypothetical protein [Geobacter sp. FeAm09]